MTKKDDAVKVAASMVTVLKGAFPNMVLASDLPPENVFPKGKK